MAIEAYPVGANSGFSEESAIDSERDRLISAMGGRMSDFIVDPFDGGHFDESHASDSLDIDIDTGGDGMAFLGGHLVQNDSTITLTLDEDSTNEIFLIVADGEDGNAAVVFTSDDSEPDAEHLVKIWEAETDGSGVTDTTDFRPYVPFRDGAGTEDSVTGRKTGESDPIPISSNGLETVDVTFDEPYRDSLDQVILQPRTLDDDSVEFGYYRAKDRSVDGFTIEARVASGASSGDEATFDWIAQGK